MPNESPKARFPVYKIDDHAQPLANEWVQLSNSNRIFGGITPLAYLIKGGLPAMQTVRRLLDAQRNR